MRMYTDIFEQDGETIAIYSTHAANEEDAGARCDAFFREYPEHVFPLGDGVTIRVERVERRFS